MRPRFRPQFRSMCGRPNPCVRLDGSPVRPHSPVRWGVRLDGNPVRPLRPSVCASAVRWSSYEPADADSCPLDRGVCPQAVRWTSVVSPSALPSEPINSAADGSFGHNRFPRSERSSARWLCAFLPDLCKRLCFSIKLLCAI